MIQTKNNKNNNNINGNIFSIENSNQQQQRRKISLYRERKYKIQITCMWWCWAYLPATLQLNVKKRWEHDIMLTDSKIYYRSLNDAQQLFHFSSIFFSLYLLPPIVNSQNKRQWLIVWNHRFLWSQNRKFYKRERVNVFYAIFLFADLIVLFLLFCLLLLSDFSLFLCVSWRENIRLLYSASI